MLGSVGAALLAGAADGAPRPPEPTRIVCVERCAGGRAAAVGAAVRVAGKHLGRGSEIQFRAPGAPIAVIPERVSGHTLEVVVPEGAVSGRPRVVRGDGRSAPAPRLRIAAEDTLPAPGSFKLRSARARPKVAFFDARGKVRLRYRFDGYGPTDLRIELHRGGKLVRTWEGRDRAPFVRHTVRWNGLNEAGRAPASGRYRFRIGVPGRGGKLGARFRFGDHLFPVRGRHRYGDRFGAPRSGGRTHEGQDLWAACGTRLEAARGGTVQFRGYSGALYGHYVVIDGRKTDADYMYAHLNAAPPLKRGARVRTGDSVGSVGRSGNARGEGCQLHFELWPSGWHQGRPTDPLGDLRRWDGWS